LNHIVVGVVLLHRGVFLVLVNDLGVLEGVGVGAVVVEVVVVYLHYVAPAARLPHATGSEGVGRDRGWDTLQGRLH